MSDVQPKLRHRKACPTIVNTLSEKLRIKRLELGLTQLELAERLAISKIKLGFGNEAVLYQPIFNARILSLC